MSRSLPTFVCPLWPVWPPPHCSNMVPPTRACPVWQACATTSASAHMAHAACTLTAVLCSTMLWLTVCVPTTSLTACTCFRINYFTTMTREDAVSPVAEQKPADLLPASRTEIFSCFKDYGGLIFDDLPVNFGSHGPECFRSRTRVVPQ